MKIDVCDTIPSQWLYLKTDKEESLSEEDNTIALLGIIEQEIQKERRNDSSLIAKRYSSLKQLFPDLSSQSLKKLLEILLQSSKIYRFIT